MVLGDKMPLTRIKAENFTVFESIEIPFGEGLNVLVGENGIGKTKGILSIARGCLLFYLCR